MGWKAVKDYYRIGHIVQVRNGRICIGSPYIPEIIVIDADGNITKRDSSNADLKRYMKEFSENLKKLSDLVQQPDEFERSIPVFTYDGGKIIEKQCENLGWPNVTHDGEIMYDNTHSADRGKVVEWAKKNAEAWIKNVLERIAQQEKEIEESHKLLDEWVSNLEALKNERSSS